MIIFHDTLLSATTVCDCEAMLNNLQLHLCFHLNINTVFFTITYRSALWLLSLCSSASPSCLYQVRTVSHFTFVLFSQPFKWDGSQGGCSAPWTATLNTSSQNTVGKKHPVRPHALWSRPEHWPWTWRTSRTSWACRWRQSYRDFLIQSVRSLNHNVSPPHVPTFLSPTSVVFHRIPSLFFSLYQQVNLLCEESEQFRLYCITCQSWLEGLVST